MSSGPSGRYLARMVDEDSSQQTLEAKAKTASHEIEDDEDEDEDDVASPFDHPAFLPVLLWALVLWFGYDGFLNPEFQEGGDSHEHVSFNRYGFAVLITFAIYNTVRALRERRGEREAGASGPGPSAGE